MYRLKFLNLFDQIRLLVVKLFVLWSVCVEARQELNQFLLIAEQNVQYWFRFVWISNEHLNCPDTIVHFLLNIVNDQLATRISLKNTYLEYMKGLELDVAWFLFQHVHHQLQIVGIRYVPGHYLKLQNLVNYKIQNSLVDTSWQHDIFKKELMEFRKIVGNLNSCFINSIIGNF